MITFKGPFFFILSFFISSTLYFIGYGTNEVLPFYFLLFLTAVAVLLTVKNPQFKSSFLIIYSVFSVLSALTACYAYFKFGVQQSTKDVSTFSSLIVKQPPFPNFGDVLVNSPLALHIWQEIYNLHYFLGFSFNTSYFTQLNTFLVALSISLFAFTAKQSLTLNKRIKVYSLTCGVFWLFSAVAMRDSFILFVYSLLFVVLILYVKREAKILSTLLIVFTCVVTSFYLRQESAIYVLFLFFFCVLIKNYSMKSISGYHSVFLFLLFIVFLLLFFILMPETFSMIEKNTNSYKELSELTSSEGSLGSRLIIGQPLPVRAFIGSLFLIINPIPLWHGFLDGSEYLIFKSVFGVFLVFTVPLFVNKAYQLIRYSSIQDHPDLFFSIIAFILSLVSISITSLEFRHLGVCMPLYIYVIAHYTGNYFTKIAILWFLGVVTIHFIWAYLKFI